MKICRLSFLAVDEALYKAPAADEHFQELAKDIHESNKNISNPYEQKDSEQSKRDYDYYAIFELEQYIDDIKANNADKCILEREQYIDDISTNNADKHVVGYYEDKVGTCKNITFRDGPSGQGSI
jgi:hypothetical protein